MTKPIAKLSLDQIACYVSTIGLSPIHVARGRGQHENDGRRDVGVIPKRVEHFESAHPGHVDIGEHQHRSPRQALESGKGVGRGLTLDDLDLEAAECPAYRFPIDLVVVHNQNRNLSVVDHHTAPTSPTRYHDRPSEKFGRQDAPVRESDEVAVEFHDEWEATARDLARLEKAR